MEQFIAHQGVKPTCSLRAAMLGDVSALAPACVMLLAGKAQAADQTISISTSVTGPIYGNGDAITVTGSGTISGGSAGIRNGGTIGTLTNSGTISGSSKAIYSTRGGLGEITNSGVISGGIYIENQNVTIIGGSG